MIQQSHFQVHTQNNRKQRLEEISVHHVNNSTIHNSQKRCKQPIYPLTDKWIREMWYIHMMEYYSALKGKF